MKSFLWVVFLALSGTSSMAQRLCGTAEYQRMHPVLPVLAESRMGDDMSRDTVPNEVIIIPVVVHVLFNTEAQNISDAQVRSQLAVLNADFRRLNADTALTPAVFRGLAGDARIMFCLSQVDPFGRPTKGIVRRYTTKPYFLGDDAMKYTAAGGDDAWDSRKYLNIWVCSLFGRSLGYATPPGGATDKDGVVINYDVFGTIGNLRSNFNKGRTATHEVAHWLGLKHIWGDEDCGNDEVDDTPTQQSSNYHCPVFPQRSTCSPNAYGDMFMNFMDFTDDACMNMFSRGQVKKMRSLFARNALRNGFLNSFVCDSSLASGAPVPDDTLVVAKAPGTVTLYPNPAGPVCYLEAVGNYSLQHKTASVYQSTGALVLRKVLTNDKETLILRGLAPGVYLLSVGDGADRRTLRFIRL